MPGPGDQAWVSDDYDAVMEYLAEERLIHAACGQPLDLTTGKANARAWRADDVICHACGATEAARNAAAENAHESGDTVRGQFFVPVYDPGWSIDDGG